jgi:16S rRNA processing protein RimM
MENYTRIGKFVATFGVKGDLILVHHLGEDVLFKQGQVLFMEEGKGKMIPHFIARCKSRANGELLIGLDGIDAPEQAKKWTRREVWLLETDLRKIASASAPVSLLGFEVLEHDKVLGLVEEVIEQPTQVLLRLTIQQKEVLIPLHEQTLVKVERKKKKLHVVLPEGLLDIYLT